MTNKLSKLEWIVACALTLLALFLHVSRFLHAGALWRDEAAAVGLATQPTLGEVFQSFPHEAFPLVFPLAVRTWVAVTGGGGGGDMALRVFGLLVGLGLLAALWWNAWIVSRTPPLVSLALLGISPVFFQHGDAVRGYGLGSLFLLLTFGSLAAALWRGVPPSRGGRIATLVFALFAVHCLIPNWALLGALCLAAAAVHLWRRRQREAVLALGLGLVAALSLLPYAGPLLRAREWNVVAQAPSAIRLDTLGNGLMGVAGAPVPAAKWAWVLALILAVLGGLRLFGARPTLQPEGEPGRDRSLFGLLTVALGIAACFLFLALLRYDPRPWYFLPLLVLLASAFDLLIAGLGLSPGRRLALAAGALVLGVALFLPGYAVATVRQTNADLVAQTLARAAAPADLVLVNPWYNGISFGRYYHGPAPWLTLPEVTDHRFHRYDLLKARMASPRPIDDVLESLGAALGAGHRVWVVGGLHILKPDRRVPTLPPAPNSRWGWSDVPYSVVWSQQVGAFLQAHALRAGAVEVPAPGPVSDYERLRLLVFDGWRE